MIHGARIRQARELRGLLQRDLAARLGVTAGRLAQIEKSEQPVSLTDQQIAALVSAVRLPSSFFEVPLVEAFSEGSMRFRARASVSQRALAQVRREAELAHEIAHVALHAVQPPASRVPNFVGSVDVEEASAQARAALGIAPDGPIPNVLRAIERGGVWIYAIGTRVDRKLDGFSLWTGDNLERPVIILGEGMSWDRQRFTASHELGHLVLHRAAAGDDEGGRRIERQADEFASAFLMPKVDALEEMPRPVTLSQLAPLKLRWGMSLAALVNRAWRVGVISDEHRTSLFKQLSARRWRITEPGSEARSPERPRALRKMLEVAFDGHVDPRRVADRVGRYSSEVVRELERYASAPTGRHGSGPSRPTRQSANVIDLASRR